jgi:diguanylate cyclase (GGDEF)-like protein
MRIRTKLTTGVVLLVTLYAVTALFFVTTLQQSYQRGLETHTALISSQVTSQVESSMLLYRDQLALLARDQRIQGSLAEQSATAETARWIERHFIGYFELQYGSQLFTGVELYDPQGTSLLRAGKGHGAAGRTPPQQASWWKRTVSSGFSVDLLPQGNESGEVTLRLAVRMSDSRGETTGVLAGYVDFLLLMKDAELQVKPFRSTVLTVLSADGNVLYRSIPFRPYEQARGEPFSETGETDSGVFTPSYGDEPRLYAYSTLGTRVDAFADRFHFVVSYRLAEALSEMRKARMQLFGFLAFLLVVASLITVWLYRSIKRPLDELLLAAERIGSRDLESRPEISGRDEMSFVLQQFDAMRERLRYFYDDLAQEAEAQRRHREAAEFIAGTDELTGLANRRAFFDYLIRSLGDGSSEDSAQERTSSEHASPDRPSRCVIYFDLNGFKPINDTYGHHVGDRVLAILGDRLSHTVRSGDIAARVGGDEFATVLTAVPDRGAIEEAAQRIIDALSDPIHHEGLSLRVGISAGIAVYPEHGQTAEQLVQHADHAMYLAKESLGPERGVTAASAIQVYAESRRRQ